MKYYVNFLSPSIQFYMSVDKDNILITVISWDCCSYLSSLSKLFILWWKQTYHNKHPTVQVQPIFKYIWTHDPSHQVIQIWKAPVVLGLHLNPGRFRITIGLCLNRYAKEQHLKLNYHAQISIYQFSMIMIRLSHCPLQPA